MTTVTLYGINLPEQGQKLIETAVSAGERDHKAWVDLAKYLDVIGFTGTLVRSKYGDDKASHKQLTALIVNGLPAATSNAMNKPAKSRTTKEKTLAELGQQRVGVYRVRLAKYLDEIQGVKPNNVQSDVQKTVGHKVAQKLTEVLNLLIKSENLTGLPNGYRLSEHITNLKNEYKAIAGESYKDSE
jgi:hypothetical protein